MKIAVLGSAASVARAPFQNQMYYAWAQGKAQDIARAHDHINGEFDIWACSPGCWGVAPRATRWFEVHRWELNVPWFSPEYRQFLRDFKGPVYTGGTVEELKNHVIYPIDYIEEKFASYFLTSSLALMMALAIDTIEQLRVARKQYRDLESTDGLVAPADMPREQFMAELAKDDSDDVIGMWGVDMSANEEYGYQRPGCQFFVLEAFRRDIGVFLPNESDLMRPMPVYGISEWDHNYIKTTAQARHLNARLAEARNAVTANQTMIDGIQGELHALNYYVQTWTNPYGFQHGILNRQVKGTGLGSGITSVDTRPIERMTVGSASRVIEAMAAPAADQAVFAEAAQGRELVEALTNVATGDTHYTEAPKETLTRLIGESGTMRLHSSLLQSYILPGESTTDALRRLVEVAVNANKPKGKKR